MSAAAADPRKPTPAQRRAASPDGSAWVAASAGTGKTAVLIDRILRLLLAGAAPQRLLCLTFTKAAAQEMALRLTLTLRRWATLDDAGLAGELAALAGLGPSADELARARRLFSDVLEAPGGLRLDTIHAFCQSMLRRFPLEATLPPDFHVLDERSANELLRDCLSSLLATARAEPGGELVAALRVMTARTSEQGFGELLAELMRERGRLRRLIGPRGGLKQTIDRLYAALRIRSGVNPEKIVAEACLEDAFKGADLRRAAKAMASGSKKDRERGVVLAAWLAATENERAEMFGGYLNFYLTEKGEGPRRKDLAYQEAQKGAPDILEILSEECVRLENVRNDRNAAYNAAGTAALIRLGAELEKRYRAAKLDRSAVDYDDLILAARDLLRRPGMAPWVLYKLDGGIDHVLVDEAQDTNPEQWEVIEALTGEFFSGEGAGRPGRTMFAVGDVKQSIYSFQRADPQAFIRMRDTFQERTKKAKVKWQSEELVDSFRSTEAVLRAVDAVFERSQANNGVALDDAAIRHRTTRAGDAGRVELWPPVVPRDSAPVEAWTPPVERREEDSPRARLARLIATTIRDWIDNETLEAKGRNIRAGDILILVQRRNALVELIVRELKRAKVDVAGIDRMVLADQLPVMDLIALGRFLLLPDDNLTLAALLKGPLFGFSEERLFELAHPRPEKATLWSELRARAGENDDFNRACGELSALLARVDFVRPYDLFAEVLGPRGGRRRIVARLGAEAEDSLDEFLAAALAFERGHPPALETFLHWLELGREEIKRDLEGDVRNEVRVMTVHGAKGLQAPIVILPDTFRVPRPGSLRGGPKLLWPKGETDAPDLLLWSPSSDRDDRLAATTRDAFTAAGEAEYRRLLYVAMTRASDRLYVCGHQDRNQPNESCWYRLIADGLKQAGGVESFDFAGPGGDPAGPALRVACPQTRKPTPDEPRLARGEAEPPGWLTRAAPAEPEPPKPLAPSRPEGEEPPARAPFDADDDTRRFRRGRLVHFLLQTLPELPPDKRAAAARRYLARPAHRLDKPAQEEIATETLAVLAQPSWEALFGPDSLAEAPVVGRFGTRIISGQIDRLLVTAGEVMIVDYKTNRPPALKPDAVAPIYLRQMAAYRAALKAIYPRHRVRCALLWTDGPSLLELPGDLLDRHVP